MKDCELCASSDFITLSTEIREGYGLIVQCEKCGLIVQNLDWDEKKIQKYYQSEYQETNSLVTGCTQTPQEHFQDRLKTVLPIYEKIRPLLQPGIKVLEIGCGPGSLLSLIKPHVEKCVGVELNIAFADYINDELGMIAHSKDLNQIHFKEQFDLIISIDTLDHLSNPLQTLQKMNTLLTDSGKVYLEVPNQQDALNLYLPSINRQKYSKFFWHRAHLFYFTDKTISKIFKKSGFEVNVSCRHNYTLKNYLNWFFIGKPQPDFVTGTTDIDFFSGESPFEKKMNSLFQEIEPRFKEIMAETFHGDALCCLAQKNKKYIKGIE